MPFFILGALLFGGLLIVNAWHRRADATAARLRQSLQPVLAGWGERGPSTEELAWLEALPPAAGRTILEASLEATPDLAPEAAARTRAALRRSGLAAREVAGLRH